MQGCSLEQFINVTSPLISKNHATDCLSGRTKPTAPLDLKTIFIVIGVTGGMMLITIVIACALKMVRPRRSDEELLVEPPGMVN